MFLEGAFCWIFWWTYFGFGLFDCCLLFVWSSLLFVLVLRVVRLLLYCDYLLFVGVLFTCRLVVVMVVLQFIFCVVFWFASCCFFEFDGLTYFFCLLFSLCVCVYLLIAACVDYLCLVLLLFGMVILWVIVLY